MQYMQGKGSGGMSVEETLTYDNERVFCTGNTLLFVGKEKPRVFSFGAISTGGRTVTLRAGRVDGFLSMNLVILSTLRSTFAGFFGTLFG